MCGFVVAIGNKSISNKDILNMTNVINHRGPDHTGFIRFDHINGNIKIENNLSNISNKNKLKSAAGFKRLSIRDKSDNGNQPMLSQFDNSFICFNGEIYNTDFLKKRLSKKNYVLRGNSDTEIIIEYFLEFGIEDLSKSLEGMYAIFLYDAKNRQIFLLRDRFGVKPLYYSFFKGNLVIASEIKSIIKHPEFVFSVNYDHFDEYLKFRDITAPGTLINLVNQLSPGSVIKIDKNLNLYNFLNIWEIDRIFKNNSKSLKNVLKDSISSQLVSDVEVGLQLSGGIDSSLITKITDSLRDENYNLKTFSIVFENPHYSEEKWIRLSVKNTNTLNFIKKINNNDFVSNLKKATFHLEQPINHPSTLGIYHLANLSRKNGIKVLLSGEGADELFGGYARFLYVFLRNQKFIKLIINKVKYINRFFARKLNTESFDIKDQIIESTSINNDKQLKRIFKKYSKFRATKSRKSIFNKINENNTFIKHRKYEILTYLQSLLKRQDKMNMAFGVENRVPFLSTECLKASLSDDYVSFNFIYIFKALLFIISNPRSIVEVFTKTPLKKEALKSFGNKFTFRKKSGFGFPISEYMRSKEFINIVENQLINLIDKTPLSKTLIIKLWSNFILNQDSKDEELLWTVFTFLIWLNVFENE